VCVREKSFFCLLASIIYLFFVVSKTIYSHPLLLSFANFSSILCHNITHILCVLYAGICFLSLRSHRWKWKWKFLSVIKHRDVLAFNFLQPTAEKNVYFYYSWTWQFFFLLLLSCTYCVYETITILESNSRSKEEKVFYSFSLSTWTRLWSGED
jgi:hypothetical protein